MILGGKIVDIILFNGDVYTLDDEGTKAEAIAIKKNKVYAIGNNKDILKLTDKDTRLIDLQGRFVVPGFIDSHMHLLNYGYTRAKVDLNNASSIDDLITLGNNARENRDLKEGDWILGRGWNNDFFTENRFPNRYDLDKISTEFPVCYTRACGHVAVVNSKALEIAGINKKSQQISGGKFDIDKSGEPLGIFRENALDLIYGIIPDPDIDKVKEMITKGIDDAVKQGITSIQTDDFEQLPKKEYEKVIKAYTELVEEKRLKARIYEQCLIPDIERLKEFLNKGYNTGWGNEYYKIGPLKLLSDGSLGARTAYMTVPYVDDSQTMGIPVFSQEKLDELVMTAHDEGMHVIIHCIGDAAMYMAFKSFERALKQKPKKDHRHGIVHCQITDLNLLEKFKRLNIVAYIQPIFLHYDMHIVENRIGIERAKHTYNWKSMIDMGIHAPGGSDAPVEKFDVLPNMYSAITRKDLNGYPKNGWLPDQKIGVEEALKMFTIEGAYASFEEDVKGTLEVDKYADIVVLEKNLYKIEPEEIKDVKVDLTIVGGNIVYHRNSQW